MRMNSPLSICLLLTATCFALTATPASAAGRGNGGGGGKNAVQAVLDEAEAEMLTFMREEEKLARDVYLVLFEMWGQPVFSNIAASEQRHMDSLKSKLDKYGLPDPTQGQGVGDFTIPELQDLYNELILDGSVSLLDALMVGALIEEVDIEDLQVAIAGTDEGDLQRVYGNLMSGSDNHLRAFAGLIEGITGVPYQAQFLTQAEVDAILDDA